MTGTAMLIFACGFFIYAVSPSYANEISNANKPQSGFENAFSVASGGYLYTWSNREDMYSWGIGYDLHKPRKRKLPLK